MISGKVKASLSKRTKIEVISYTEIARRAGLSISHISRVMRRQRIPSSRALVRIAAALGVSADALLDRIGLKGRGRG